MVINWHRVRRVILNDRVVSWGSDGKPTSVGYKPSIRDLRKLTGLIPDATIIGFQQYSGTAFWSVLVESYTFFEDDSESIKTLNYFQAVAKPGMY